MDEEYLPPTFEIGTDQYTVPYDMVRDPYLYYDYVSKLMEKKSQDMFQQYSRESFISPVRRKLVEARPFNFDKKFVPNFFKQNPKYGDVKAKYM